MSTTDPETDAQSQESTPMAERLPTDVGSLVERLAQSASVRSVYGESITSDGRTVVPVARVAYGFGSGEGTGDGADEAASGGSGAGGGVMASPAGALEITEDGTRFVRYGDRRWLLAAGLVGLVVGILAGRR